MNAIDTPKLNRDPLHRQVAEILSERIVSGEMAEGSLLPPERELCETMGVSRTVIREAIKLLETRDLVRIDRGRGTLVTKPDHASVRDSLHLLLRRQGHVIGHLLEVRRILEVAMSGFAAERRTQQNLDAMRHALQTMAAKPSEPEGYVDADVEFHTEIARAAHNPVLLTLLDSVADLLRESRISSFSGPDFVLIRNRQHQEIFDRIYARDPEGARDAMRRHLADVKKDLDRNQPGRKARDRSSL